MIDLSQLSNLHVLEPMDLALHWAARGVPVLPTNPTTKAPWIGKEWERKASTDPDTIRSWTQWDRGARVGIKTGLACGCGCLDGPDVLDFDVSEGKPGIQQRQILVDAGIIDGTTSLRVRTPSGGEHWWFAGTNQHNKQNDDAIWGVDFRAHHGMVLAPGNPGYDLKSPPWSDLDKVDWSAVAACPGLLIKPAKPTTVPPSRPPITPPQPVIVAPQQAPPPNPASSPRVGKLIAPGRAFDNAPGEESPMDWFTRTHDLGKLLFDDGWKYAYTSEGRDYYVRPGKEVKDGVSGNIMINADGRQTLINFSTSVDLPTDRGMSAAQWYAYRYHGGNFGDAARAIRTTLMPRREQAPPMPLPAPPVTQAGLAGSPGGQPPPMAPVGLPGRELVASSEVGPPEPVKRFWQRRPELKEVWWQSQLGDVSPWAVLGTILACVAGRTGPHVVLPPKGGIGGPTSLNLLVAISGNTGEGKGTSSQVARGFMGAPYPPWRKPGTGQGIAAIFTEQTKEGPVQVNDTVVLNVAEIHNLGAHMSQQGATITSTLLEVYMAEELGEHYANKELRRPVREGRYRLALVAGVQPDNAGILFDHAASGLPQRFIWMPAHWDDAVLPEGDLIPPAPGPALRAFRAWSTVLPGTLDDSLDATGWSPSDAAGGLQSPHGKKKNEPEAVPAPVKDQLLVTYAYAVGREIGRDQRRKRNLIKARNQNGQDNSGDPDSHLLLTRIKVAALLAIWLDHTTHISDEMWELAGWVIWVSNDTRLRARARIRAKAQEKTAQRAAGQVATQRMVKEEDDRSHNATYIRACDRLLHLVTTSGDWIGKSGVAGLNKKMSSKEKKEYREAGIEVEDILNDMVLAGKLESRDATRGGVNLTEWKAR